MIHYILLLNELLLIYDLDETLWLFSRLLILLTREQKFCLFILAFSPSILFMIYGGIVISLEDALVVYGRNRFYILI